MIRADAFPAQGYQGEITRIAPEARIEQNVTLFDVTVLVENTDGNLRSGMNTTMEIVIVDEPDVLTIPVTALQRQVGTTALGVGVVLVKGTGPSTEYEARSIRTGRTDHRVVEAFAPVVFDATHSCQIPGGEGHQSGGHRQFVPTLAAAGVAAGADGLFIEVHDRPEEAKSDAATVYPLDALEALLSRCARIRDAVG